MTGGPIAIMVVSHFLKWLETAKVADRAAAASALARAYTSRQLGFDDHCGAEAALTLLLDDPSWKVRYALADALSLSPLAPPQIIDALANDQPEVAALVIARSPLLGEADLIDRVGGGSLAAQKLIADRPSVSAGLAAAIAEVGSAEACRVLVLNAGADIAPSSFRRICERHADVVALRNALVDDQRLPSDCRHMLMTRVADTLSRAPLLAALLGSQRAASVARAACVKGSLVLVDATPAAEHDVLVDHLRSAGDLTASFMVRMIAHGKVDFFGASLVSLTGQNAGRVRSMLASGNDVALAALFGRAGLPAATHGVILRALKVWREVANGRRVAGVQEVSWLMLKELGSNGAAGELVTLLKTIHLDALRDNARGHALAIAAMPDEPAPEPEIGELAEVVPLEAIDRAA